MILAMIVAAAACPQSFEPPAAPPRTQEALPAAEPAAAVKSKKKKQDPQEQPPADPPRVDRTVPPKSETNWKFRAGLDLEYDSNILRLDDRDVERLEDGSKPEKFRIDEPDDFIYTPWVEAAVNFPLLDGMNTAGLQFKPHLYQTNTICNYEEITLFLKRNPVTFEYTWIPEIYKQEHRDLDTGEFKSAFYSEHTAEVSARFVPVDRVSLKPFTGVRFRDFDSPFNHRDALGYFLGARATIEATEWLEAGLEYEFFLNDAFASSLQPDTSYISHAVEPGFAVKPTKGVEVGLRYRIEVRDYTTDNSAAVDPGHADRTDDRRRWCLRAAWKATASLSLHAEYRRTDVDTDLPGDPGATDEETSWSRNEVILGIVYQF